MGTLEMLKNLKGFSDTDHNHLQSSLCEADVLLDTTHFTDYTLLSRVVFTTWKSTVNVSETYYSLFYD